MSDADLWGGRCDLCHCFLEIGEVVSTLLTPSTGTREEGEAGTAFWAEDPRWAACSDCMVGIEMLDVGSISREIWLIALVTKSLRNQRLVVVGDDDGGQLLQQLREDQVEYVQRALTAFVANRLPGAVTESVNEGVPRAGES